MNNDPVFKLPNNARIAAFLDPECFKRGGYILKRFTDGYRYYPIGSKQTYVRRDSEVIELGQHVSTFYWSRPSKDEISTNCIVIPFKRKMGGGK